MAKRWSQKELAPKLGGAVRRAVLPQLRPLAFGLSLGEPLKLKLFQNRPQSSAT